MRCYAPSPLLEAITVRPILRAGKAAHLRPSEDLPAGTRIPKTAQLWTDEDGQWLTWSWRGHEFRAHLDDLRRACREIRT